MSVQKDRKERFNTPSPRLWNGQTRPLWSWGVQLRFGKHKGRTLREVADEFGDEDYIRWLRDNLDEGYVQEAAKHFLRSRKAIAKRARKKARRDGTRAVSNPPGRMTFTVPDATRAGVEPPFSPGLHLMGKPVTREQLERAVGPEAALVLCGTPSGIPDKEPAR